MVIQVHLGFGIKTSKKFFDGIRIHLEKCSAVHLNQKNLTGEDALRNARLAKILTADDYDNGPILIHSHQCQLQSLTVEQEFKMRQIEDALPNASKEDLITVYLALQRQCFVLTNNVKQLLQQW
jgi:hypothetical protein